MRGFQVFLFIFYSPSSPLSPLLENAQDSMDIVVPVDVEALKIKTKKQSKLGIYIYWFLIMFQKEPFSFGDTNIKELMMNLFLSC